MKNRKFVIWAEIIIFIILLFFGFLQFKEVKYFWKFNFETLINIFITASLGVIGFYISVSIIENNTSTRRRLHFMETQLDLLNQLLYSHILKLSFNEVTGYPSRDDFLSTTQKIRDIISNIGEFVSLIRESEEQYKSLVNNFEKYHVLADDYSPNAIKEGKKKFNQRREDMIQNVNKLIIAVYKAC